MTRAIITDSGLANRLGDNIFLVKKGREREGRLVYYPKSFAVLQGDKKLTQIKDGDVVKLWVGGRRSTSRHYREHVYSGTNQV